MERFQGQLKRDGQDEAIPVEGTITVDVLPSGTEAWSGYFTLPHGQLLKYGDNVDLTLADGRTQRLNIVRVNAGENRPTVASFESIR